jgi:hypothetical protein
VGKGVIPAVFMVKERRGMTLWKTAGAEATHL